QRRRRFPYGGRGGDGGTGHRVRARTPARPGGEESGQKDRRLLSLMKRQFFGTDGVRGPYGGARINEIFGARLAQAVTAFFLKGSGKSRRILVGRDTRASG